MTYYTDWNTRALVPLYDFEEMIVEDGVGKVYGYAVCIGEFENVENQRLLRYELASLRKRKYPIWC